MTVTNTTSLQQFVGNGISALYVFSIQTYDPAWITATVDGMVATGTITLNPDQETTPGGVFDFDVIPPDQSDVIIQRIVPLTQLVDLPPYTRFPSRNVEDSLDKITMALQQMNDSMIPTGDTTVPGVWTFLQGLQVAYTHPLVFLSDQNDPFEPDGPVYIRMINPDEWELAQLVGGFSVPMIEVNPLGVTLNAPKTNSPIVDGTQLTTKDYVDGLVGDTYEFRIEATTGVVQWSNQPLPAGFVWSNPGVGNYSFTHDLGSTPYLQVTQQEISTTTAYVWQATPTVFEVRTRDSSGTAVDVGILNISMRPTA